MAQHAGMHDVHAIPAAGKAVRSSQCRRMHDEMRAAADSPRLSALTAKTVGKALQLMAEKAEYMAFAGKLQQACLILHSWTAMGAGRLSTC